MITSIGYAASEAHGKLAPLNFERREVGPNDIKIDILFCGICHSDLHFVNNDWGNARYPIVPGHEIIGKVVQVGSAVSKFKTGDIAGIGCIVDSCRVCEACKAHEENNCAEGMTGTYGALERGTKLRTYGGYSNNYVVDENYALQVSAKVDLAATAPLLCAGITTYSPLRRFKVGPGKKIGVVGLGGLGHMGVKIARALGAHVVVLTTSPGKVADALRLGAHEAVLSTDKEAMKARNGSLDFILDTVSAPHDINQLLKLLRRDSTLCLVGLPEQPLPVQPFVVMGRKALTGSGIGGIQETQEMLDFCAEHNIVADIERITIQQLNDAYARLEKNDVKYRFVIDMASLKA